MKKLIILVAILSLALFLTSCEKKERNLVSPEEYKDYPIVDNYVLIWGDEFNSDALDLTKWTPRTEDWGGGNKELQYYTPENVSLRDGNLVLTAEKIEYKGKQYKSGKVTSQYKSDWLYGKFEIRAKVPGGRGTWPAIWMMPTKETYGGWPKSGEIDIMEYVGYDKNRIHGTIHTEAFNHKIGTQLGKSVVYSKAEDEFVVYSMLWEPMKISIFINEIPYAEFAYAPGFNQDKPGFEAWPFDHPFYLIMNFAIGGDWGGAQGVDTTIFPKEFLIDYVRVYQKDYAYADNEKPNDIKEIKTGNGIKNMIYWEKPVDDQGIEEYLVYVDGELQGSTKVNSYVLTKLTNGQSYEVGVVAVDFAGNKTKETKTNLVFK